MTEQLYRVLKTASGTREFLTGALPLGEATAHLRSVTENMVANGYNERTSTRKLPVTILAKDMRTVTLAVVDCTTETTETTPPPAANMSWLVRSVNIDPDLRDSRDITIDPDLTPTEGLILDNLREGGYPSAVEESAGV